MSKKNEVPFEVLLNQMEPPAVDRALHHGAVHGAVDRGALLAGGGNVFLFRVRHGTAKDIGCWRGEFCSQCAIRHSGG